MGRFGAISADSHVVEPPDFWAQYIDPKFRDRAPRLVQEGNKEFLVVEGLPPIPLGNQGSAGRRSETLRVGGRCEDNRQGGWDPEWRARDMDTDGVDAEVLYPTICMGMWRVPDIPYQYACMHAYNNWMVDFCSGAPGRLLGLGLISLADIEEGVKELRRIAAKGLRGACISAVAPPDRPYSDPAYNPLWATAQELKMPLSLHILTGTRQEADVSQWMTSYALLPRWIQESLATLIGSGVMERFPELKFISVENDIGWIALFLHRLDHFYDRHRYLSSSAMNLPRKPSEYFYRQVYATFIDDEAGIKTRHLAGVDNIMWSSDYPHSDSIWPNSQAVIRKLFKDVPEEEKRKIVHDNVARLYNLTV